MPQRGQSLTTKSYPVQSAKKAEAERPGAPRQAQGSEVNPAKGVLSTKPSVHCSLFGTAKPRNSLQPVLGQVTGSQTSLGEKKKKNLK